MFMSAKAPVPYVHFASPSAKHACPKSAACWSPAIPAMGRPSGRKPRRAVRPTTSALPTIFGSTLAGTRKWRSSSGSHSARARFMSSVRDAFVTSVDVHGAGGELAHEEAVDGAEGELAPPRRAPRAPLT